jgi:hypothetical protein
VNVGSSAGSMSLDGIGGNLLGVKR